MSLTATLRNYAGLIDRNGKHVFSTYEKAIYRYLSYNSVWAGAICIAVGLQVCLVVIHQPWLDEWQALLISLQSPTWGHLLENLRYEGHPPLWYALLRLLGVFVPLYALLWTTQAAIALGILAAILSWRIFSRTERLLIVLSYFILIEFGTVARSLSLGALLLILFFRSENTRIRWTIACLLPLVDFQFGVISIIFIILLWRERRWSHIGIGLWALAGLFAAWSVRPAPDMIPALDTQPAYIEFLRGIMALSTMLIPVHLIDYEWHWAGSPPPFIGLCAGVAFVIFAISELRRDSMTAALFGIFLGTNFAMTMFVYPIAIRHWTLVPILFILLVAWLRRTSGYAGNETLFRLWLAVVALAGLGGAILSITMPFDTGYRAARFIKDHRLQDKHWIVWPEINGPVISALIGRDIHSLGKECGQSFIKWNFRTPIKKASQLEAALDRVTEKYGRVYLIIDQDIDKPIFKKTVRKLAAFAPGYDGQVYQLYVVKPELPETSLRPPSCLSAHTQFPFY